MSSFILSLTFICPTLIPDCEILVSPDKEYSGPIAGWWRTRTGLSQQSQCWHYTSANFTGDNYSQLSLKSNHIYPYFILSPCHSSTKQILHFCYISSISKILGTAFKESVLRLCLPELETLQETESCSYLV